MPEASIRNVVLSYDTAGESGSPVLLIMGFGVPGHLWRNQIAQLSDGHEVAWFDNPGAGGSKGPRVPASLKAQAAQAAGLVEHLGWRTAHVVGVSMGGMIAQELALRHPERVRSLSLIATHAGGLRNLLPPPRALALFVKGFLGPKHNRAHAMEELIFPPEYLASVDRSWLMGALREEVVESMPASSRVAQLSAILRHRTHTRLSRLAGTPTLVVSAGKDVLIRPSEHVRLHHLIPGSRLVHFENAGHGLLHQCAERLNDELLRHFRQVDGCRTRRSRPYLRLASG